MLKNQFNPLLAKAETQPRPGATGSPSNKPAAEDGGGADGGEGSSGDQEEQEDDEDEEEEEASPAGGAAAAAEAARPPALSVFERGKLRALGMGGLISRLEKAEGDLAVANATIAQLQTDAAKVPGKIKAAKEGRQEEVSRAVTNELTSLGINPEDAPSQTAADQTPDALLEKFNGLQGAEKTAFYRANKSSLRAAQAAADAKKSK